MFFWRVGLPDGVFWDPNDLLFVLPPENDFFRLKRPETDFDVHVKIRFWPNSAERLTLEIFLDQVGHQNGVRTSSIMIEAV